ncbi:MAG TPA: hypothetical protein VEP89_12610 [Draconibacterium sp.]|nr:hypothetical protein [Draconibacterium sp.]
MAIYRLFALLLSCGLFTLGSCSSGNANQTKEQQEVANPKIFVIEDGGTGQYPAIITEESSLPGFTIYRPQEIESFASEAKLPVILWGSGGCANTTDGHKNFLNDIASNGYIILGSGIFDHLINHDEEIARQKTTSAQLLEALDWIIKENSDPESKYYNKIDVSQVASMGMSCGGVQAIEISGDPRISTTVVCNSGVLKVPTTMAGMPDVTKDALEDYHNPVLYLIGGPSDMAYENAVDDFERIDNVPVVMTNLDVGHGGTYSQPHGGAFTPVALAWLNWQLKGDESASEMFLGENCVLCEDELWTIESKNF